MTPIEAAKKILDSCGGSRLEELCVFEAPAIAQAYLDLRKRFLLEREQWRGGEAKATALRKQLDEAVEVMSNMVSACDREAIYDKHCGGDRITDPITELKDYLKICLVEFSKSIKDHDDD